MVLFRICQPPFFFYTMDSTVSSQAQPSKRLACNRCHQQKLRCHRNLLPGRPCARCENAGTECRFEPPLRPGRPSSRCKVQGLQKSAKDTETVIANSDQLNYASRHHTPSVGRQDVDVDLEGLGDSTRCDNAETAGSFLPLTFAAGYVSSNSDASSDRFYESFVRLSIS